MHFQVRESGAAIPQLRPTSLRLAAFDGDRKGFSLADEDDEPLPSDHACVEEVLRRLCVKR